ncbi:hypothetical protein VNI00_006811 [Paramarasmius palmivorus]|uniref:F-box domain-containing protein n=1 Tax=Paramarasmius palmivorus TaxID=297713 RepID=A0AAW0D4Q6_9AGAR
MPLFSCPKCGVQIEETTNDSDITIRPPFMDALSRSNDPLSHHQYDIVHQQYQEMVSKATTLDASMAHFRAILDAMVLERQRLTTALRDYKVILHPIRRLPHDILAHIFDMCLDADLKNPRRIPITDESRSTAYPGSLNTKKAPWVLAQVCSRWRQLALSLPQLWTGINLNWAYTEQVQQYSPAVEPLLGLQLQRCRDQPLAISYYGQMMAWDIGRRTKFQTNERLLMVACSRSLQWSTAYLGFGDIGGVRSLLSYTALFPSLENLHIELPVDMSTTDQFEVFRVAPKLRHLMITGNHGCIGRQSFPWYQIIDYVSQSEHVDGVWALTNEDHFRILPFLQNVQICDLEILPPEDMGAPVDVPQQRLVLSHLHTLTLRPRFFRDVADSVREILVWLTLPALRTLEFPSGFESYPELVAFLNRSSCHLQKLSLVDAALDDEQVVHLLGMDNMRGLHTLTIGIFDDDDGSVSIGEPLLTALRFGDGDDIRNIVLPNLVSLTLRGDKRWTDARLIEMVSSRRQNGLGDGHSRLQYLNIVDISEEGGVIEDPDALAALRQLNDDGFVFKVNGMDLIGD